MLKLIQKRLEDNKLKYIIGYLKDEYFVEFKAARSEKRTIKVKLKERNIEKIIKRIFYGIDVKK